MKVWIVCDNNITKDNIILFDSLEKADKYTEKYSIPIEKDDCWIVDKNGSVVH